MEVGLSLKEIAPIFQTTIKDPSLVKNFPDEFQKLIPELDLSIFKKKDPTEEELFNALKMDIEKRTEMMKYIHQNQKFLTETKIQKDFIGALIIQSFIALIISFPNNILPQEISIYIALLVMSYEFVSNFTNEIDSLFLIFLTKISNSDDIFGNMPDISVLLSHFQ